MELYQQYKRVRTFTEELCQTLVNEDYVVQSMPDTSPVKWHLAHTTWFFEEIILTRHSKYKFYNDEYRYLFNSYYSQAGKRFFRPQRGMITRPGVEEIFKYRNFVNVAMLKLLGGTITDELCFLINLGLNHEQQHQELIITDVKHLLSYNPLHPVYNNYNPVSSNALERSFVSFPEGLYEIGFEGSGFAFDNESPRHKEYLYPFSLASNLVTNKEYLEFIKDGGYEKEILWLSDGWTVLNAERWKAPYYWEKEDERWMHYTLHGYREIIPEEPVTHISYYEADAFARWAGFRLPTEGEWETASSAFPQIKGNFAENKIFHPTASNSKEKINDLFGNLWEWTVSPYSAYPGFKPFSGIVGEYNGKFMCNQFVLRGGSCATPISHIRSTYRNFFHPDARWQFSGIRLAKDN